MVRPENHVEDTPMEFLLQQTLRHGKRWHAREERTVALVRKLHIRLARGKNSRRTSDTVIVSQLRAAVIETLEDAHLGREAERLCLNDRALTERDQTSEALLMDALQEHFIVTQARDQFAELCGHVWTLIEREKLGKEPRESR
ncbi:MAG: hypothetical protein G01um1014106_235 [Parcubacteria group bacterium Gr01-1014_106]|nr:MAG: hypothetical protein G01um1014106_235 [Parcubacteria group bacterium Gr01-1014_106]